MVSCYVDYRIKQHAPNPFAHKQSHRLRVGLATVLCWRQVQSVNINLHLFIYILYIIYYIKIGLA